MFRHVFRHIFRHAFSHVFRHALRHAFRYVLRHVFRHLFRHVFRHVFTHVLRNVSRHVEWAGVGESPKRTNNKNPLSLFRAFGHAPECHNHGQLSPTTNTANSAKKKWLGRNMSELRKMERVDRDKPPPVITVRCRHAPKVAKNRVGGQVRRYGRAAVEFETIHPDNHKKKWPISPPQRRSTRPSFWLLALGT